MIKFTSYTTENFPQHIEDIETRLLPILTKAGVPSEKAEDIKSAVVHYAVNWSPEMMLLASRVTRFQLWEFDENWEPCGIYDNYDSVHLNGTHLYICVCHWILKIGKAQTRQFIYTLYVSDGNGIINNLGMTLETAHIKTIMAQEDKNVL